MYSVQVAWSQIIGARKSQQDSASVVTWPNGFRLLLLADGMGGHVGGDIASHLVIDTFKQHFIESDEQDIKQRLINALDAANVAIYHQVKEKPELSGMGTTLIAAVFDGLYLQWLSVGDSPMWLLRDKTLVRLNENHSMSEVLARKVELGEISSEDARTSPIRSQLLEAVMGENIERVDAPDHSRELKPNDLLILASDGVESCSDETIIEVCHQSSNDTDELTMALLNAVKAQERLKQDNATLIVMQVKEPVVNEPATVQPEAGEILEEPSTH